ncbi:MAG: hypothetical protein R3A11_04395 [Bdellovibrionota bacterium]
MNLPVFSHRSQTPSSLVATSSPSESTKKQFELEQTSQLLATFVKENPNAIEEYLQLGRLFRIQGFYRKAFRLHRNLLYRQHLDKKTISQIYAEMGHDYLESQTKDCGQNYFELALKNDSKNTSAQYGLFLSFQKRNLWESAIDCLKKISKTNPDQEKHLARMYAELALQNLHEQKTKSAKRNLKKSFHISTQEAFPYLVQAQIELHEGEKDLAKKTLQQFIEKWPGYSLFALKKIEDLHYETGNYGEFGQTLRESILRNPKNSYLHHYLANHHLKMKKYADAKLEYQEALSINPLNINAVEDYLQFCLQQNEIDLCKSVVRGFSLAFKAKRQFECSSCKKTFHNVPKDCQRCLGWNTFSVRYSFPGP